MPIEPYFAGRTLLVTLPRGAVVHAALTEALVAHQVERAWIVGRGTLEEVELRDEGAGRRTLSTLTRIVALDGRADAGPLGGALHLSATVTRSSTRGAEIFAGEVVRAIAGPLLELLVTPLENAQDRAAGAMPSPRPTSGRPSSSANSARSAPDEFDSDSPWAAVAAASAATSVAARTDEAAAGVRGRPTARRTPSPPPVALAPPSTPIPPRRSPIESIDETIWPEAGDFVHHFAFGRQRVVRSDGDQILVHGPDGERTRTLHLAALELRGPFVEHDGTRLFRLTKKGSIP